MKRLLNKLRHNTLFGIIIGGIVFGIAGVSATVLYQANQISYTPSDSMWKVDNVKDAIDDLFSNTNSNTKEITKTIKGTSFTYVQVDAYDSFTNSLGYTKLTMTTLNQLGDITVDDVSIKNNYVLVDGIYTWDLTDTINKLITIKSTNYVGGTTGGTKWYSTTCTYTLS